MAKTTLPISSNHQPSPHILGVLLVLYRIFLIFVGLLSVIILLVWFVPVLRPFMPYRWDLTKPDTAICLLLCVFSLLLSQPRLSSRSLSISRWMAGIVILGALTGWVQYFTGLPVNPGSLLVRLPPLHQMSNSMSPQTASILFLLGIVMALLRARKNIWSWLADASALLLVLLMLTFISGYFFGARQLLGPSESVHMSPQTMVCLSMLTFVVFSRRAEYGIFSILLGSGIGSRTARTAAPIAMAFPWVLAAAREWIIREGLLQPEYATASATALMATLGLCLILILSQRINRMESEIRVLSLRDELTGLYNRRGFYVLAEQSQALARRADKPFSILFLDVDGLKQVNDKFGHEAGSLLLCDMAAFMEQSFRETDVIGRLGGDEFAIACGTSSEDIGKAIQRLNTAISVANAARNRPYTLSYSYGYATSIGPQLLSLDALLKQADVMMYESKRDKKSRGVTLDIVSA